MFKDVFYKLEEIAETASTLDKTNLIKKHMLDPVFAGVVKRALSSDTSYYINKLPPYCPSNRPTQYDLFTILDNINSGTGCTNDQKNLLAMRASTNTETYEVVKRIVNKDLKCGIGVKSINKAVPNSIYYVPYCRCSGDKAESNFWKKSGKKYAQLKEDGMFANLILNGRFIEFLARSGKEIFQLGTLKKMILDALGDSCIETVFTGELLIVRDGKILDRQTGNGILNKLIHATAPQNEADSVAFHMWDAIPLDDFWDFECTIPYSERRENCKSFVELVGNKLFVDEVYSEEISSEEEAKDFYIRMRLQGEEGSILKLGSAIWADHTSPNMIKKKNISSCALKVVGWKHGEEGSKYEDVMGAVFFESEDGKLKVAVNGRTDEMRAENWDEKIGAIYTILFERVSYAKNKIEASLYQPRIDKYRPDKTKADTLKEIINRQKTQEYSVFKKI